jgi:acetyl-CoA carboxylase carboxyl transferase subunit alpha
MRGGAGKPDGAAKAMKITAQELIGHGIVDRIIPEPLGGAHANPAAAIKAVGDAVEDELKALLRLSPAEVKAQRAARFLAIGRG